MYDIAIIGGGINGCGIARDAAGRGYSVYLAEQGDLASGTSSSSTKLIHGGLRYLEYYEFRLVRQSLKEREILWAMAPHIVRPMRFVLPHHRGLRPAWLLRLGLFLYDHIGGRKRLAPTAVIDMKRDLVARPLKAGYRKAFEYSDCWVDDARLVVLNARDAADRGACIETRSRVRAARREADHWLIEVEDVETGIVKPERARILVNASGPWIDAVLAGPLGIAEARNVRLVQGSHIVVPKLYDHEKCYFFQNDDGRIFFAIPYEGEFTLVGTTDRDFEGDPGAVGISEDEIEYLCRAASQYFRVAVTPDRVVWSYSGVRPLYDDGATKAQEATRDYVIKSDGDDGEAKLINIFGGKITTYRRLAEAVLSEIGSHIGRKGAPWSADAPLPGGDFPIDELGRVLSMLVTAHPYLDRSVAARLVRGYGTLAERVLGDSTCPEDLGTHFGAGLYEREVTYLLANEWARTAADILWRRTKLGLHMTAAEAQCLGAWLHEHSPSVEA